MLQENSLLVERENIKLLNGKNKIKEWKEQNKRMERTKY